MDSTQVLAKLSLLIQTISSVAEKATVNRKNCQTLAASIQSVALLICEFRESKMPIIGGAITSFEGLERVLCKAKGLVMKCGGETSVLYAFLRRESFAHKFKLLTLEIETHVNSLPLGALQLTDTMQEQVKECISELHEAIYDAEGEEELRLDTESVLKELKEGVKLSHKKLADLASRFGLSLNQDILREASLLKKEKGILRAEKNKHEEELINQLIVLVTKMEDDLAEQKQAQAEFGGILVPADFRCPLSLELMSDPVIVASGQTYERGYIQQWLDQGNTTCPKTRQTLNHTNLIPNYTVKALIANWCEANRDRFPEPNKLNNVVTPLVVGATSSLPEMTSRLANFGQECRARDGNTLPTSVESQLPERLVGSAHMRFLDNSDMGPLQSLGGSEGFGHFTHRSLRHALNGDVNGNLLSTVSRRGDHNEDSVKSHSRNTSSSSVASSADDSLFSAAFDENSNEAVQRPNGVSSHGNAAGGELQRPPVVSAFGLSNHGSSAIASLNRLTLAGSRRERGSDHNLQTRISMPPHPVTEADTNENDAQMSISQLVGELQSGSIDVQRNAATTLRLLAKRSMDNRVLIANCGAIKPLVTLLDSADPQTQENAVTALLNLSMNDNNKNEIAAAGAINPLVKVLRVGNSEAKENSAATLFSLSVTDENRVAIGQSGAIPPLVDLLMHGSPRGKKDAATALFNLSILPENKGKIVDSGAIKPLVELMVHPAAGMVDRAVDVLANLATTKEGRAAIGEEGGIPALVEVVELGSHKGKENAAAALLHLCTNNHNFRAMVLQEGAIPLLFALSQSGTARAKEKACTLLRHFREQGQAVLGRGVQERHMDQHQLAKPYG